MRKDNPYAEKVEVLSVYSDGYDTSASVRVTFSPYHVEQYDKSISIEQIRRFFDRPT